MRYTITVWMSGLAIAGVTLFGAPRTAAAEPPEAGLSAEATAPAPEAKGTWLTAERAAALAREYREKAAWLRSLGGAELKSTVLRWTEEEAAHYAAEAVRLTSAPALTTPEAAHFRALAATYRLMGGATTKAGLVARAEEMARRYEAPVAVVRPPETALARHLRYGKAIEAFWAR